jgi:pilus assembly protein CpaD
MSNRIIHKLPALLALTCAIGLSACAGANDLIGHADPHPDPVLPSSQYAMTAETQVRTLNFRVEHDLSDNQRRALDQVAARAAWTADNAIDVQIVTSGDPASMAAGRTMANYLYAHDVADKDLTLKSAQDQASDIVTVNLVSYRAHHLDCNQSWENLAATGGNQTYQNFGCAVTANLAAQVADPRDIDRPHAAAPVDDSRKSNILDKYRQGKITSAEVDQNAKGNVSDAIQ